MKNNSNSIPRKGPGGNNGHWFYSRDWLSRLRSPNWQRRIDSLFQRDRVWGVVFVAFFTLLLLRPGTGIDLAGLQPGDLAPVDIRSPYELEVQDEGSTQERQQAERDNVLPVYDYNPTYVEDLKQRLHEAFERARNTLAAAVREAVAGASSGAQARRQKLLTTPPESLLKKLRQDLGFRIDDDTIKALLAAELKPKLESGISAALTRSLRGLVVSNPTLEIRHTEVRVRDIKSGNEWKEENLDQHPDLALARSRFTEEIQRIKLSLTRAQRRTIENFFSQFVIPTLTFNSSETEKRRDEAAAKVVPLVKRYPRGKLIARQGEELNEEVVSVLRALGEHKDAAIEMRGLTGNVIVLIMLGFFLWRYASFHSRAFRGVQNLFGMLVFISILIGVLAWISGWIAEMVASGALEPPYNHVDAYHYLTPVAAGAMLVTLLANARIAMVYSIFFSLLYGMLLGWNFHLTLFSLLSHFAAIYGVTHYQQRTALYRAGALVGLANFVAAGAIHLLTGSFSRDPLLLKNLLLDALCGFAGGLLVVFVVSFLLPWFESLFNVLTDVRLLELSNLNNPLLKRLALVAPGSYNHSVMVGTLTEAGAEALRLNPLFCRVAAYYHDIGKVTKPDYFVENQRDDENRHEKLAPHMSALIISSHVKEGLRLGREHNLPQRILDIIPQHHGTRLMSFFYKKAKKLETEVNEVDVNLYRYQGPKPQTKEAAIFMLADAIEAAARTLEEPTPQRLRDMMKKIANDIVLDGQLDQCDLTFADLDRILDAFVKTLVSVYHHRIEYPDYRFPSSREREEEEASVRE
jgi:putative nucleotidyltransferase with HDIG domain